MTFKFDSECLYLEIGLYDAVDVVNTFIKSRTCVKQGIHFFCADIVTLHGWAESHSEWGGTNTQIINSNGNEIVIPHNF